MTVTLINVAACDKLKVEFDADESGWNSLFVSCFTPAHAAAMKRLAANPHEVIDSDSYVLAEAHGFEIPASAAHSISPEIETALSWFSAHGYDVTQMRELIFSMLKEGRSEATFFVQH